jgi:hypothetical protein
VVSVDAQKLQRHIFPDRYGVHRCATFGDLRNLIKDAARFLGFDVIEEDV